MRNGPELFPKRSACKPRPLLTAHPVNCAGRVVYPLLSTYPTTNVVAITSPSPTMPSIHDNALAQAVADLIEGRYPSIRAATKAYSVPELTLRNRYHNKSTTRTNATISKRLITP